MRYTAGIDVGSTYTKAVILSQDSEIVGRGLEPTGFKLSEVAESVYEKALADAGLVRDQVQYSISTGFGRHQAVNSDVQVTDLTASARGACLLFPGTRTILDVGGQTMKMTAIESRVADFADLDLNTVHALGGDGFARPPLTVVTSTDEEMAT